MAASGPAEEYIELEDYHWLWITIIANLVPIKPTALICYDYLLTLSREMRHVWRRGRSNAVVLFCVVRYPALIGALAAILALAPWRGMSNEEYVQVLVSCGIKTRTLARVDPAYQRIPTKPVFSALRVHALSARNSWLFGLTLVLGLVNPMLTSLTLAEMAISSSVDPHLRVCNYSNQMANVASTRGVIIARSSSIIADVLVIVVTWARAWPMVREAASLSVEYTLPVGNFYGLLYRAVAAK
ncbi:hypothetical protein C8Q78DRAFT_989412 [Trametes maxima]|nr:hypothetical protein C8Q78DRAFT_989412 [Trametes maxima]